MTIARRQMNRVGVICVSERTEQVEDQKGSDSKKWCRGARNQAKKGKAGETARPFPPEF